MKKRFFLLLLSLALASCGEPALASYSGMNPLVFHSYFSWTYDTAEEDISNDIYAFLDKVDRLADPYNEYPSTKNLYTINHTENPVVVDPILIDMLETALDLQEKTEGYFNPLIGKVTTLWKETLFGLDGEKEAEEVTEGEILAAEEAAPALIEEMNESSLIINKAARTVQRVGGAHIDLGGLVKGYCVEKVQEMILKIGSVHYLLNGGQSSLSLGKSSKDGAFQVILKYSFIQNENVYAIMDADTSTSAIYEQPFRFNGKWYSHIMNPLTGIPCVDYSMAFLVGQDSAFLDAFSTSCMIAGTEKTEEWAEKYGFQYALFKDAYGGYAKLVQESPELTAARVSKQ